MKKMLVENPISELETGCRNPFGTILDFWHFFVKNHEKTQIFFIFELFSRFHFGLPKTPRWIPTA